MKLSTLPFYGECIGGHLCGEEHGSQVPTLVVWDDPAGPIAPLRCSEYRWDSKRSAWVYDPKVGSKRP